MSLALGPSSCTQEFLRKIILQQLVEGLRLLKFGLNKLVVLRLEFRSVRFQSDQFRIQDFVVFALLLVLALQLGCGVDLLQQLILLVDEHSLKLVILVFDRVALVEQLLEVALVLFPSLLQVLLEPALDYPTLVLHDLLDGNLFVALGRLMLGRHPVAPHVVAEEHLDLFLRLLQAVLEAEELVGLLVTGNTFVLLLPWLTRLVQVLICEIEVSSVVDIVTVGVGGEALLLLQARLHKLESDFRVSKPEDIVMKQPLLGVGLEPLSVDEAPVLSSKIDQVALGEGLVHFKAGVLA
eukprot:CAMPEP_0170496670 /NCGR_PEP_ID=MMETSP0208-20121228/22331_1 /TAXON_ID=197538 /ORGANISM="Strombidium inclinatum, Strain S3" /LENGTH=294 /DNA_ID=CAMNT_0010773277 /DNA_START=1128 /DNA_END=2014 /DNA_ORIENTATION=-